MLTTSNALLNKLSIKGIKVLFFGNWKDITAIKLKRLPGRYTSFDMASTFFPCSGAIEIQTTGMPSYTSRNKRVYYRLYANLNGVVYG